MWKRISNWLDRRNYRNREDKIQRCGLYVVDDFGLALPIVSTAHIFPGDEKRLKSVSTRMSVANDIGSSVLAALDYSGRAKKPSLPKDYTKVQASFLHSMERYRKSIGVGKRRYESHMQLITVTREDGNIHLHRHHKVHGRFAFEGTQLPSGKQRISDTSTAEQIGRSALTLLGE